MFEEILADPTALRVNPKSVRVGSVYGMTPGNPLIHQPRADPAGAGRGRALDYCRRRRRPARGRRRRRGALRERAHRGVDSEFIVRSAHSTQTNPHTIAEVRRILLLHADEACAQRGVGCGD